MMHIFYTPIIEKCPFSKLIGSKSHLIIQSPLLTGLFKIIVLIDGAQISIYKITHTYLLIITRSHSNNKKRSRKVANTANVEATIPALNVNIDILSIVVWWL